MDVSVILVSYNTKEYTSECIKSVFDHTQNLDFEIIVVDNDSKDGSCEMITKSFPQVKLIKNETNMGFGAANNIAIKQCNGKYVLCLNTDTILVNDAINKLFEHMEKAENINVGVCGGLLLNEKMEPGMSYFPFPTTFNSNAIAWFLKRVKKYCFKSKPNNDKNIDAISGADIFFRKSVLDEVGYFDENFFMYFEEADLCKRIQKAGYHISFVPEAKIIHFGEKSSISYWHNLKQRVKSKYLFIRKHSSLLNVYLMKLSFIFLHTICYIFTLNKKHLEMIKLHYYEK